MYLFIHWGDLLTVEENAWRSCTFPWLPATQCCHTDKASGCWFACFFYFTYLFLLLPFSNPTLISTTISTTTILKHYRESLHNTLVNILFLYAAAQIVCQPRSSTRVGSSLVTSEKMASEFFFFFATFTRVRPRLPSLFIHICVHFTPR